MSKKDCFGKYYEKRKRQCKQCIQQEDCLRLSNVTRFEEQVKNRLYSALERDGLRPPKGNWYTVRR